MERPKKFYPINDREYCYMQGTQKDKCIIFVMEIDLHTFLFSIPLKVMKKVIEENK